MSEPSLRELLAEWLHEKARSLSEYRLFEGLIEAVESEETPTDEEYNDAREARIRFLQDKLAKAFVARERLRNGRAGALERLKVRRTMCDSWEGRCHKAERELAAAQAKTERLDTECDRQALWRKETERELTEAKAQVSDMAATLTLRKAEADQWQGLLALSRTAEEKLRAERGQLRCLATIGELVGGMEDGTALQHTGSQYYAMRCCPGLGWHAIASSCATNPTEALKVIQEVEAVEPSELTEANDLREQRDGWERGCWEAEQELAEARAETKGLREERDAARMRLAKWLDTHSQLVADAALGRLVRGMQPGGRLMRIDISTFASTAREWEAHSSVGGIHARADTPTEALKAIQEVGSA